MHKVTGILVTIAAMSLHAGNTIVVADQMKANEAKETPGERLSKDLVKGTLVKIEGEDYWIKVAESQVMRIHVDRNTKADKVVEGDKVKASVTDERHATTLQRQEK